MQENEMMKLLAAQGGLALAANNGQNIARSFPSPVDDRGGNPLNYLSRPVDWLSPPGTTPPTLPHEHAAEARDATIALALGASAGVGKGLTNVTTGKVPHGLAWLLGTSHVDPSAQHAMEVYENNTKIPNANIFQDGNYDKPDHINTAPMQQYPPIHLPYQGQ